MFILFFCLIRKEIVGMHQEVSILRILRTVPAPIQSKLTKTQLALTT